MIASWRESGAQSRPRKPPEKTAIRERQGCQGQERRGQVQGDSCCKDRLRQHRSAHLSLPFPVRTIAGCSPERRTPSICSRGHRSRMAPATRPNCSQIRCVYAQDRQSCWTMLAASSFPQTRKRLSTSNYRAESYRCWWRRGRASHGAWFIKPVDALGKPGEPGKPGGALNLGSMEIEVDPRAEWEQMFRESCASSATFSMTPTCTAPT